jgi:hypothetical protein
MTTLIGMVVLFGSIIVEEKKDENLSASNAAESLSDLSESGESSDRDTTEIAHRAQSSTVATRTTAHDHY